MVKVVYAGVELDKEEHNGMTFYKLWGNEYDGVLTNDIRHIVHGRFKIELALDQYKFGHQIQMAILAPKGEPNFKTEPRIDTSKWRSQEINVQFLEEIHTIHNACHAFEAIWKERMEANKNETTGSQRQILSGNTSATGQAERLDKGQRTLLGIQ